MPFAPEVKYNNTSYRYTILLKTNYLYRLSLTAIFLFFIITFTHLIRSSSEAATPGYFVTALSETQALRGMKIVDLDGDGDNDIVASTSYRLDWFENINNTFTRHIIDASNSAGELEVSDFDKDGDIDIVGGSGNLAWYENNGSESFTRREIVSIFSGLWGLQIEDIDDDGDNDIFVYSEADSANPAIMGWYENNGGYPLTFTLRTNITNPYTNYVSGGCVADFDSDGDIDMAVTSELRNAIAWWSNDGNENFGNRVQFESSFDGYGMRCLDLDYNNTIDIIAAGYNNNEVAWWSNNGTGTFTKHSITSYAGAFIIEVIDINNDGNLDILVTSSNSGGEFSWLENDGNENFTKHVIHSNTTMGHIEMAIGEIDGINSGMLDFITSEASTIGWYRYGYSGLIENLQLDTDAVLTSNWSTNIETGGTEQNQVVSVGLTKSGTRIAEVDVDFYSITDDLDWSSVTVDVNIAERRSVVANLTSAPHAGSTHTLYVPKLSSDNSVHICPNATVLNDISLTCADGYTLTEESSNVEVVNISGQDYWKISGLTGTGGLGYAGGTPNMRVDLANESINATDDVEVWFATPTDVTSNSLIYIIYESAFTGGSSLTDSDINLYCDPDGLTGGGNTPMTTAYITIVNYGYLVINTGSDNCSNWIQVDIHGGGGNHLTNPNSSGNYSWAVVTDVGANGTDDDSGAVLAYVADDNDVFITTMTPPVIDLELFGQNSDTELTDPNTCPLGVLSINAVNTCTYDIGTGTNNSTGISVYITSDGGLDDGFGNDINATTGIVNAGVEEYGFYISDNGGGEYTIVGSFGTQHQQVPSAPTLIATTSSTGSGTTVGSSLQHIEITHASSMSTDTVVGSYNQVVTYTAFTN